MMSDGLYGPGISNGRIFDSRKMTHIENLTMLNCLYIKNRGESSETHTCRASKRRCTHTGRHKIRCLGSLTAGQNCLHASMLDLILERGSRLSGSSHASGERGETVLTSFHLINAVHLLASRIQFNCEQRVK